MKCSRESTACKLQAREGKVGNGCDKNGKGGWHNDESWEKSTAALRCSRVSLQAEMGEGEDVAEMERRGGGV